MRNRAIGVGLAAQLMVGMAQRSHRNALPTEGFETSRPAPRWSSSNGWTYTGGNNYDIGIEASGITGKSVRISNGTMSGSFGDWLFSPAHRRLRRSREPGVHGGVRPQVGDAGRAAAGSADSVAPQTAGGARMSFVKFTDTPGWHRRVVRRRHEPERRLGTTPMARSGVRSTSPPSTGPRRITSRS